LTVFDSTFLIDLSRTTPTAQELRDQLADSRTPLRVPAAAWVEYLHVLEPMRRVLQEAALEDIVTFTSFDREIAAVATRLQHELSRSGAPLGWHDLQIAATALHFGEPLVTRDEAFERIPGLEVIRH
jgi:predicted nucleic acid-binding protein